MSGCAYCAGATGYIWRHEKADGTAEEVPFDDDFSEWTHIAVSFRADGVYSWWSSNGLARFERYQNAAAEAMVVINGGIASQATQASAIAMTASGGASIALDEVMADGSLAISEATFRRRTIKPIAWAARRNESALSLMASETEKIATNLDKAPAIQAAIQAAMDACVPLGMVYTQLPFMQPPAALWAWAKWQDISAKYEGAFFRAMGGNSAKWKGRQDEGLPNITGVCIVEGGALDAPNNAFQTRDYSGHWGSSSTTGGGFTMDASRSSPIYGASAHVTPVNYAVRIWQRIG